MCVNGTQHDEAREYMAETAIHGLMAVARDHRASPESVAAAASTLWRITLDSPPHALEVYRAGGVDLVSKLMRNASAKGRSAAGMSCLSCRRPRRTPAQHSLSLTLRRSRAQCCCWESCRSVWAWR